jgi:hypothetical protein
LKTIQIFFRQKICELEISSNNKKERLHGAKFPDKLFVEKIFEIRKPFKKARAVFGSSPLERPGEATTKRKDCIEQNIVTLLLAVIKTKDKEFVIKELPIIS